MAKGLSQKDYDNIAREDWYKFAVKPAMVILGMYIVSVILQTVMHIKWEVFPYLFTGVGGTPYLIFYYKK